MNKRGSVLIMVFLIVMVIIILIGPFLLKAANNNFLLRRYTSSTEAFWLAESGVAEAVDHIPSSSTSDTLDTGSFSASINQIGTSNYWSIISTGTVDVPCVPGGCTMTRSIEAVVETTNTDPTKFAHAIRVTGSLILKGSYDIGGDCEPNCTEENASINFTDLFEHTAAELESGADFHYTDPDVNSGGLDPAEALTWVDLTPTVDPKDPEGPLIPGELQISTSTWEGGFGLIDGLDHSDPDNPLNDDNGAILIIEGDAHITGGTFYGIIYVMGTLKMAGNITIYGTILAESGADIDTTIAGNVTIEHSTKYITQALKHIQYLAPTIVSWKEN